MGKYSTTFKNSLSVFIQYRLNIGLILVSHVVSLSGLIFLWLSVYASGQQLQGYKLEQILVYYVFVALLTAGIGDGPGTGFDIVDDINQGEITNYLLKPYSYLRYRFLYLCGSICINMVFVLPLTCIGAYVMRHAFTFPSAMGWVIFIITVFIAILFEFLMYAIASLSSFWVTRGSHFIYATILITSLFDGSLIPLDLFPAWAYRLMSYLPFQFIIYTPIQAFLGKIHNPIPLLFIAILWLVVLFLILQLLWRKGVKKTEGVGR